MKGKYKVERDLIGFDMETNQLLFLWTESELIGAESEEVKMKRTISITGKTSQEHKHNVDITQTINCVHYNVKIT